MLLDRYRQLLTAYVDGELTSRQRRHVARLLHRSAEARQLLQKLRADARALRHLPRPPLPSDLTGPVLRTIVERRLTPGQRRVARFSSATSWAGPLASWAAAAAVLLVLGAASYLYFAASLLQPAKTEMVEKVPDALPSPSETSSQDSAVASQEKPQAPPPERPLPKHDHPPAAVKSPEIVKHPEARPPANVPKDPSTPPKPETALTDRLEMFRFDRVPDLLPVIVGVSELEQEPGRKKLLAELHKDSNFRLELPCAHGSKAMERVQNAARTLHVELILDKPAQERLKLKWRTSFALYLENVTPEELAAFVRQIGAEDRKSAAKKPAEVQIDRLVLMRLTAPHRKELSTLLGVDPTTPVPAATGPLGTDVRKPLSDLTAQQLGKALAGQTGKATAKPAGHVALVLAYNPVRPASASEEIKRFLESRKPTRPGTIRVLLVLRS